MLTQQVFKGKSFRVQIQVFDFTDTPIEHEGNPISYTVRCLPLSADKSTAFINGHWAYKGENHVQAWETVRKWLEVEIPNRSPRECLRRS